MALLTTVAFFQFSAALRIADGQGPTNNITGHTFTVELFIRYDAPTPTPAPPVLDSDLSAVIEGIKGWCHDHWQDAIILQSNDRAGWNAVSALNEAMNHTDPNFEQKSFPLGDAPTTKHLARYLLETVGPLMTTATPLRLCKVVIRESMILSAEASI
jgi:6-pyruvoyl-tetrahydropterin synthase